MDHATALNRDDALTIGLDAAVQLHMLNLRQMHGALRDDLLQRWAAEAADEVASKGDILQYRSSRRGETAKVFNHLARGLAALAYQPGGVTFAGRHWCANHAACLDADAQAAARPSLLDATHDEPAGTTDDDPDTVTVQPSEAYL